MLSLNIPYFASSTIVKLMADAATLSPSRKMTVPLPAPTPGPLSDFAINQPFEAASPSSPQSPLLNPSLTLPPTTSTNDMDVEKRLSRMSENWEVLSESGASLISPAKSGMTKSSSVRSWKSANNGESLSEFGGMASTSPLFDKTLTNQWKRFRAGLPDPNRPRSKPWPPHSPAEPAIT
jgi:hypothetical protein